MSDLYYSNYRLKKGTEYFVYIGELKNYGLNGYLAEALSRIHGRPFDFIAICPDVFEQYNYDNLIVVNPLIEDYACRYGQTVSCRVSARRFMAAVSASSHVKEVIRSVLARQERLYIYMYESLPEMTLDELPGVTLLGPKTTVASRLNSKIYQHRRFQQVLPMPEAELVTGAKQLRARTARLWGKWSDGIFVTAEYSAAGVNSTVARMPEDLDGRFEGETETFLISRYIPHRWDPTVLAVAAGKGQVYIAGVADQQIEAGNRFIGSLYPSVLEDATLRRLGDYTRQVGEIMVAEGYRGIFGCDFIVDEGGEIRFLEVNARKQGTTMEFCCTLEQCLPPGAPLLPELEYWAVCDNRIPDDAVEPAAAARGLCWGTHNYKLHRTIRTDGFIPQSGREREAFGKVARRNLKKDFLILEHVGSDFIVAEGSFLARIVALGTEPEAVRQGLRQGIRTIQLTISEDTGENR